MKSIHLTPIKALTSFLLVFSSTASIAIEKSVVINTSEYKVRIHTSRHPNIGAQNTAILIGKSETFANSFFLNYETDSKSYASLLLLMKTSNKILVRFDDAISSPWGDNRVFAITTLESMDGSLGH